MKTAPKTAAPIIYPPVTLLHLSDANLCVGCEMIHDQPECPSCTSSSMLPLREILNKRLQRKGNVVEVDLKGGESPMKLVVDS